MSNPISPSLPKTTSLQQIKQRLPIYMVIGLLQIQFANNTLCSRAKPAIQAFISHQYRVQDLSPLDKGNLRVRNNLPQHWLQLIRQNLLNDLYIPPIKLIGRKSLSSTAPTFFGISETKVAFRLFSNFSLLWNSFITAIISTFKTS